MRSRNSERKNPVDCAVADRVPAVNHFVDYVNEAEALYEKMSREAERHTPWNSVRIGIPIYARQACIDYLRTLT